MIVVLAMFAAARFYLYLDSHDAFGQLNAARLATAFLTGLRFDLAAACMALVVPFSFMNFPLGFATNRRWFNVWGWLACALACTMVLVLVADVRFYHHMGRHIFNDLVLLKQETDAGEVGRNVAPTVIAVVSLILLVFVWWQVLRRPLRNVGRRPIIFLLIVAAMIIGIRGHVHHGRPMGVVYAFHSGDITKGNLSLNGVFTAVSGVYSARRGTERRLTLEEATDELRKLWPDADPTYPFTRNMKATPIARNAVIIIFESWSNPYVDSISGGNLGLTPNFDALAREGRLFRRFYAVSDNSQLALQAALSGYPRLTGMPSLGRGLLTYGRATIFGALALDRGYRTLLIQPAKRHAWRYDLLAPRLGLESYFSGADFPLRRSYPELQADIIGWDYDMLMFSLERIKELGEPFLSVLLTGSTHRPFGDPGPPFRIAEPYVPNSKEAYFSALTYADWSLGEFMRLARSTSWFDDTVFILFGDHPVRIFSGTGTRAHDLRDRYLVPMLIYAPGRIEPGISDTVSSQLDVLPTLMELLGFNGTYAAVGESLLRRSKGWALISGDGPSFALIGEKGYVSHNLRHRLEAGGTDDPAELDRLERQLLALDAAVYHALRSNRWLPAEAKIEK